MGKYFKTICLVFCAFFFFLLTLTNYSFAQNQPEKSYKREFTGLKLFSFDENKTPIAKLQCVTSKTINEVNAFLTYPDLVFYDDKTEEHKVQASFSAEEGNANLQTKMVSLSKNLKVNLYNNIILQTVQMFANMETRDIYTGEFVNIEHHQFNVSGMGFKSNINSKIIKLERYSSFVFNGPFKAFFNNMDSINLPPGEIDFSPETIRASSIGKLIFKSVQKDNNSTEYEFSFNKGANIIFNTIEGEMTVSADTINLKLKKISINNNPLFELIYFNAKGNVSINNNLIFAKCDEFSLSNNKSMNAVLIPAQSRKYGTLTLRNKPENIIILFTNKLYLSKETNEQQSDFTISSDLANILKTNYNIISGDKLNLIAGPDESENSKLNVKSIAQKKNAFLISDKLAGVADVITMKDNNVSFSDLRPEIINDNVYISAENDIVLSKDKGLLSASGKTKTRAINAPFDTIDADNLEIYSKNNESSLLKANGNVIIRSQDQKISADKMLWSNGNNKVLFESLNKSIINTPDYRASAKTINIDTTNNIINLIGPGEIKYLNSNKPVETKATELSLINLDNNSIKLHGNASMTNGDFFVSAENIFVDMAQDNKTIDSTEGSGNVKIIMNDITALGDQYMMDMSNKTLIMIGNPFAKITSEKGFWVSQKLIINGIDKEGNWETMTAENNNKKKGIIYVNKKD